MTNKTENDFLTDLKTNKTSITIFLINGVKLQGIIVEFDDATIILQRSGHSQIIYKQSISTITPSSVVNI